jgi:uncharacterized protein involved in outer membrane biogenesis
VKKLGITVGALFVLLLAAMVIIPLVVDVDKYRPQIIEVANQKLNGHLTLGHLKLSLWGQVRIEVDGLTVEDSRGTSVVGVKSAYFHLPFLSLLSGSPVVDLMMDHPTLNIVKYRGGKMNVMTLMKGSETASASQSALPTQTTHNPQTPPPGQVAPPATAPVAATPSQPVAIPAIAANTRIGFELRNALVNYKDETTGMTTEMKDLNVVLKDVSLSHPSQISIWSDFDTRMGQSGKVLTVKGPGRVDLDFSPHVSGGKLDRFTMSGKADFDGLAVMASGSFEKKAGVPANVELSVDGSDTDLKIEKMDLNFANAQIKSSGTISNLQTAPAIKYSLKSNEIELKSWTELVPMLKEYELGGSASLSAEVNGQVAKLAYQARIALTAVTAKSPHLKAQPRIDGEITIATDQIQSLSLTMKAPGNDLSIKGRVLSFTSPQATFEVTSTGMDLDQLIVFPPASAKSASVFDFFKHSMVHSAFAEATAPPPANMDALLDPLRANKALGSATANIGISLKGLKIQNASMSDMTGKLYFKNLSAGLENFNMKMFSGSIKANVSADLRPKAPTYKFSTQVSGLDLGEAVKSQMAMFQNTATGKANFDMTGEGASFNTEPAKGNLKAKGSMKLLNSQLATIDIGKMAADGILSALSKVPGLSGKTFTPPNIKSKYDVISSDFGISGGKFSAPNLVGKAQANQGIDFKGSALVGLKDQSLDAKITVIDTYNLLHAKDFSVNIAGTNVPSILCEKGKPFTLPVAAGCTMKAPCYSYNDSTQFLGKIVASNMSGQTKQAIVNKIAPSLPPALGNKLKSLFGH